MIHGDDVTAKTRMLQGRSAKRMKALMCCFDVLLVSSRIVSSRNEPQQEVYLNLMISITAHPGLCIVWI